MSSTAAISTRRRATSIAAGRPVCVDLDGTLIAGDLLWESFVTLLKQRPLAALALLLSIFRGKAQFKRRVAEQTPIDPTALPYRQDLLDRLDTLHQDGAHLVLATASDQSYAEAVAGHLGLFAEVIGSDGQTNVSGQKKADLLTTRFGPRGFDYLGNDWTDIPVWRSAAVATAVGASPRLVRHATTHGLVKEAHATRRSVTKSWLRALRPHQWVKNLLVFAPLLAAHRLVERGPWIASVLTFVTFSLCASAIYVLNDIVDIPADRLHKRKRTRPFAAGELSIPAGIATAAVLLVASLAVAIAGVSVALGLTVLGYVITTSAYSLWLKRKPVADVFTLTSLYVLRIVAGGIATDTPLSTWFLAFGTFFFLSLAFVKRYVELNGIKSRLPGRGYGPDDALWMHAIGTSAGHMAVLVLVLYVSAIDVAVLYSRPRELWLLCPVLLFWITRLWFRAGRGLVHDDPVLEALKDPASYLMLAAASVIIFVAI